MLWKGQRQSQNVEDRRGMRIGGAGLGVGGVVVLALVALLFGVDPTTVLQEITTSNVPATSSTEPTELSAEERELGQFVSVVLADTEDAWHALFRQMNLSYREPKLVLFTGVVQSACGMGQAAAGPFYCPGDQKVYIDLGFYRELRERFQAPGDFAQAYVIAHEVGHHVQNLLGISGKVQEAQRANARQANALSVRLELQADCFAGVWANHTERTKQILEAGDVEEGLNAASAIGDDRLMRQTRGGYVSPDSFTHGSSAQRVSWFKRGLTGGNLRDCDTFAVSQL